MGNIANALTGNRFVEGLPFEDYLNNDAISKSMLSTLKYSPGIFYRKYIANDLVQEVTPAMVLGRAIHTVILEPHLISEEIFVMPEGMDFRKKADREARADMEEEHAGKAILKHSEYMQVIDMQKTVYDNPDAAKYINADGKCELSAFWTEPNSGLKCKARYDKLVHTPDGDVLVDVKSTRDGTPAKFAKDCKFMGYDLQAASYLQSYYEITGKQALKFVFIAVDKTPPYSTSVYTINRDDLTVALERYHGMLGELSHRLSTDNWPRHGHISGEMELSMNNRW